jgi:CheY-like chemotaxis protein
MEKKILVVDDELLIRKLFEEAFSSIGYTVRTAESGEDALKILDKESIHVIFLDLNMPGMNGMELCRRIRNLNPMAIIHAVTGYASLFEIHACREAGFDDYFIKPVALEELFKAAESAFDKFDRWRKR